jgi:hypothetical protein
MRAGIPSWRTRTQTCRSRVAESLFPHRCITLCDSTAETECTPDIYRVILLRMAASACQSNMPLRFLMRCRSGLPSPCSAGRQSIAITQANRNRVFHAVRVSVHSWVHVFRLRLPQCGGVKIRFEPEIGTVATALWAVFAAKSCRLRNRPATGRWLQLVVGAGCLGPVRKLDKISHDINCLVALGID